MKTDLKNLILARVSHDGYRAFSCYDFTDLASYKTISKRLERMEDDGYIKRIVQGIYCLSLFDEVLSLPILPPVDDVVKCLARKHRWLICPTGNTALNVMGLSTQVPASYTYISNGPYKEYSIYGIKVNLKRTMNREISNYTYITLLLIQSIKAIGKGDINDNFVNHLKNNLSSKDKSVVLKETTFIQAWIRNIIVKICKE